MKLAILALTAATALASQALPVVDGVTWSQASNGKVTVGYVLSGGPAVVTVDVQTNVSPSGGWASIGGAALYGGESGRVYGDVNKVIDADGPHSIYWNAPEAHSGVPSVAKGARAVVTAWPLDDKPDYMVVDISQGQASADRVRYYQSADCVPGGELANTEYRLTSLLFRKVSARDVQWTMGSVCEYSRNGTREAAHVVTLTNSYYLGVFPITQRQCNLIYGTDYVSNFPLNGAMRLRDRLFYHTTQPYVRGEAFYPDPPVEDSLLGKLRAIVAGAIDFDLPSEAQWEFAATAGGTVAEGSWNTARAYATTTEVFTVDAWLPGRYKNNQSDPTTTYISEGDETSGTPFAGTYAPNALGFYDMHGGVREWCLDWAQDSIGTLGGAVNAKGPYLANGVNLGTQMVVRGGSWSSVASECRAACRGYLAPASVGDTQDAGMRIACRNGLK